MSLVHGDLVSQYLLVLREREMNRRDSPVLKAKGGAGTPRSAHSADSQALQGMSKLRLACAPCGTAMMIALMRLSSLDCAQPASHLRLMIGGHRSPPFTLHHSLLRYLCHCEGRLQTT